MDSWLIGLATCVSLPKLLGFSLSRTQTKISEMEKTGAHRALVICETPVYLLESQSA